MDAARLESEGPPRLRWFVSTLVLAPLALFAYGAFEWLFFVTKPSPVSVLPAGERLLVLVEATLPLLFAVLCVQAAMSLLSLVAFPRFRVAALMPAAVLLSALVLVLVDNFLNAIFDVSAARPHSVVTRVIFAAILIGAFFIWMRKLEAASVAWRKWTFAVVAWAFLLPLLVLAAMDDGGAAVELPVVPTQSRMNVLLLSIDGVDAERLSAYGYGASTSPFLLSLRDETLFCENAFSNAAQTYGSLTSLLTGRLPFETGVIVPPSMLRGDAAFDHLPGILNRSGYRTLQLSMRHFADAEDASLLGGFDRSNYRWENRLSLPSVEQTYDVARPFRLALVDRIETRLSSIFALRRVGDEFGEVTGRTADPFWSDARRIETLFAFVDESTDPWFVHVHLLDTHAGGREIAAPASSGGARYDRSLAAADRNIEGIFDALAKRRQLERTIVVVTSDHGSGWTTTRRIPLLIRFPHGRHARREVVNVSNIDVAPTVLDALGVETPAWMSGRSLLRAPLPERPVFAVASSGEQLDAGLFALNVPRPPNYGARAVSVILGSSWYAIDLRTGLLERGPVGGHTRPRPAVAPAAARALLDSYLSRYDFEIASDPATPRGRAK